MIKKETATVYLQNLDFNNFEYEVEISWKDLALYLEWCKLNPKPLDLKKDKKWLEIEDAIYREVLEDECTKQAKEYFEEIEPDDYEIKRYDNGDFYEWLQDFYYDEMEGAYESQKEED